MIPISTNLSAMINAQIGRELSNKHLYRQFASYAHTKGLKNIEKFFKGESEGEQGHADIFMKLLDEANVQISIPDMLAKPANFKDCMEVAQMYVDAEVETTDHLDEIYRASETDGNVGVSNQLADLLQEQIEEQGLSERTKAIFEQASGNLLLLDLMFDA